MSAFNRDFNRFGSKYREGVWCQNVGHETFFLAKVEGRVAQVLYRSSRAGKKLFILSYKLVISPYDVMTFNRHFNRFGLRFRNWILCQNVRQETFVLAQVEARVHKPGIGAVTPERNCLFCHNYINLSFRDMTLWHSTGTLLTSACDSVTYVCVITSSTHRSHRHKLIL